jgi:hypothetical protein
MKLVTRAALVRGASHAVPHAWINAATLVVAQHWDDKFGQLVGCSRTLLRTVVELPLRLQAFIQIFAKAFLEKHAQLDT